MVFPSARLRIGVIKGTRILDTHEFAGTLWDQLDGAMERFRRLLKVALDVRVTAPTLEGLRHREVWEYPFDALREAVTNALVHRDYAAPGDIQVRLLDDSLQIWNPGALPEGIRLEQLTAPSQVRAVVYVKERGSISNKEYRELSGVKERTATMELGDLVEKGILERVGTTGRGTRYAARKAQKAQ